jgi:ribose transport system substrate-binding protein
MSAQSHYLVQSVINAVGVLSAFGSSGEMLRLRDIVERTGFNRGMCFRFLYTLHHCGFLEKVAGNRYRLLSGKRPALRFRIGFASAGQDSAFSREVLAHLTYSARSESIELVTVEDRYNPKVALRNADRLIRESVDLVTQFQADQSVAAAIAAKYLAHHIPIIAIDTPHPGATYFGANHYDAALLAGRHLGRWAAAQWGGTVDELLLLELARAGSVARPRVRGMIEGVKETLGSAEQFVIATLDGDGQFKASLEAVRRRLRGSHAKRILVGAANDSSALGALRAFEEAGRVSHCAVVGHKAEPETRVELRQPRTRPSDPSPAYRSSMEKAWSGSPSTSSRRSPFPRPASLSTSSSPARTSIIITQMTSFSIWHRPSEKALGLSSPCIRRSREGRLEMVPAHWRDRSRPVDVPRDCI